MLPALSKEFGIKPHDIDQMTVSEVDVYVKALSVIHRERTRQEAEWQSRSR